MTTTISPGLGHNAFTQQGVGATPGYDAIDFRRLGSAGLQEGVLDSTSHIVTQRGAGATMSVDIAASVGDASGSGVSALVWGDSVAGQGLYPIPPHTGTINESIAAAHASLPRVDMIVLEVLDNVHDSSGSNLARTRVVAGTATSGATLNNRTGAAALPNSCLLLADVLVAAGATSITNAAIRDRRKWARGAFCRLVRNANASAIDDYTTSSSTYALIDGTNLAPRIECSGVPLRVRLRGVLTHSTAGQSAYLVPTVDGVGPDGMPSVGAASAGTSAWSAAGAILHTPGLDWTLVPSAGSHIISVAWATSAAGASLFARASRPLMLEVEEILRQNTPNNAGTTG